MERNVECNSICCMFNLSYNIKNSPGQLVFGRDMIMNIQHTANWEHIKQNKQKRINQNNQKENSKRIEYIYKIGEQVLLLKGNRKQI
jgi:hypothetical protein